MGSPMKWPPRRPSIQLKKLYRYVADSFALMSFIYPHHFVCICWTKLNESTFLYFSWYYRVWRIEFSSIITFFLSLSSFEIFRLKIFSCILYFVKIRMKYTVSSIKFCMEFGDVFYSEIIYYFSDCYACCLPIWIFRNYILVKGWFISSRNHLSFKPPFKRNLSELS